MSKDKFSLVLKNAILSLCQDRYRLNITTLEVDAIICVSETLGGQLDEHVIKIHQKLLSDDDYLQNNNDQQICKVSDVWSHKEAVHSDSNKNTDIIFSSNSRNLSRENSEETEEQFEIEQNYEEENDNNTNEYAGHSIKSPNKKIKIKINSDVGAKYPNLLQTLCSDNGSMYMNPGLLKLQSDKTTKENESRKDSPTLQDNINTSGPGKQTVASLLSGLSIPSSLILGSTSSQPDTAAAQTDTDVVQIDTDFIKTECISATPSPDHVEPREQEGEPAVDNFRNLAHSLIDQHLKKYMDSPLKTVENSEQHIKSKTNPSVSVSGNEQLRSRLLEKGPEIDNVSTLRVIDNQIEKCIEPNSTKHSTSHSKSHPSLENIVERLGHDKDKALRLGHDKDKSLTPKQIADDILQTAKTQTKQKRNTRSSQSLKELLLSSNDSEFKTLPQGSSLPAEASTLNVKKEPKWSESEYGKGDHCYKVSENVSPSVAKGDKSHKGSDNVFKKVLVPDSHKQLKNLLSQPPVTSNSPGNEGSAEKVKVKQEIRDGSYSYGNNERSNLETRSELESEKETSANENPSILFKMLQSDRGCDTYSPMSSASTDDFGQPNSLLSRLPFVQFKDLFPGTSGSSFGATTGISSSVSNGMSAQPTSLGNVSVSGRDEPKPGPSSLNQNGRYSTRRQKKRVSYEEETYLPEEENWNEDDTDPTQFDSDSSYTPSNPDMEAGEIQSTKRKTKRKEKPAKKSKILDIESSSSSIVDSHKNLKAALLSTVVEKPQKFPPYIPYHKTVTEILSSQSDCSQQKIEDDLETYDLLELYKCAICGGEFSNKEARDRHEEEEQFKKFVRCPLCCGYFGNEESKQKHIRERHEHISEYELNQTKTNSEDGKLTLFSKQCPVCKCLYDSETRRDQHLKYAHKIMVKKIGVHVLCQTIGIEDENLSTK